MNAGNDRTVRETTAAKLKWIAVITMLIDHIAVTLLEPYLILTGQLKGFPSLCYALLRGIGRMAFPIYLFLMVEGFFLTRSRLRYAGRLLMLAFLSEIPMDLAFCLGRGQVLGGRLFSPDYQNVFFELLSGFIALLIMEYFRTGRPFRPEHGEPAILRIPFPLRFAAGLAFTGLLAFMAEKLRFDYGWMGVTSMMAAYLGRVYFPGLVPDGAAETEGAVKRERKAAFLFLMAPLILGNLLEACALVLLPLIGDYRGKKGTTVNRWFFYFFYPAHLLALGVIRLLLGLPQPL